MMERIFSAFGRMSRRERILVSSMIGVLFLAVTGLGQLWLSSEISSMEAKVDDDRGALQAIYAGSAKFLAQKKATDAMRSKAAKNVELNLKLAVNEIAKKIEFTARDRRGEITGQKKLSDVMQFDQTQEVYLEKKKKKRRKKGAAKEKKEEDDGYYRRDQPITLSDPVTFEAIYELLEKIEKTSQMLYVTDIEMTREFANGYVARLRRQTDDTRTLVQLVPELGGLFGAEPDPPLITDTRRAEGLKALLKAFSPTPVALIIEHYDRMPATAAADLLDLALKARHLLGGGQRPATEALDGLAEVFVHAGHIEGHDLLLGHGELAAHRRTIGPGHGGDKAERKNQGAAHAQLRQRNMGERSHNRAWRSRAGTPVRLESGLGGRALLRSWLSGRSARPSATSPPRGQQPDPGTIGRAVGGAPAIATALPGLETIGVGPGVTNLGGLAGGIGICVGICVGVGIGVCFFRG